MTFTSTEKPVIAVLICSTTWPSNDIGRCCPVGWISSFKLTFAREALRQPKTAGLPRAPSGMCCGSRFCAKHSSCKCEQYQSAVLRAFAA